ncbi:MAG: hypothetical protein B6I30_03800 [Desulfobacteraceae bacterium 4572_187]|nr:MAG: hypothetical protein B6I30_03800 [Desulfobacteraceae bacterium 4572_187]RLB79115.1 MAG: hypothetical protein DRH24_13330 [Deltaproteobacteria bacterium]
MPLLRLYKFILLLLLFLVVAGLIFLLLRQDNLNTHNNTPEVPSQRYSKHRLNIKGFEFDSLNNGEKMLSIKADNFTIEKKKLGFFRLGLINVAIFENAVIDIYLKRKLSDNRSNFIRDALPSLRDALPSFSTKRISSITLKPVCLKLRNRDSLFTQITSKVAIIRLKKHNILFKGNVQVVSGNKRLYTKCLTLLPEESIMKTEQHFILKTAQKKMEGEKLTVDIFLNLEQENDKTGMESNTVGKR